MENGFLDHRADSVAEFLYKEEGLNKTAIGSFLGEKSDCWKLSPLIGCSGVPDLGSVAETS